MVSRNSKVCSGGVARLASLLLAWQLAVVATAGGLEFVVNSDSLIDYVQQVDLPVGFGAAEFTVELWIRLDASYPVGDCSGDQRLTHWCTDDEMPYGSSSWWFDGNWLLDGHNNGGWGRGSFDLQVYGSGRIRWLFGDGSDTVGQGDTWAVQTWPATGTPSLLDEQWHQITLVRRWSGATESLLELWIDGALVASETSDLRTDMAAEYWDTWAQFPSDQPGWYWGVEKQVTLGRSPLEDFKGDVDELRFWNRAKSAGEIAADFRAPVDGDEPGLSGVYSFEEGQGSAACDSLGSGDCAELFDVGWSAAQAPLGPIPDLIFAAGFEG